MSDTDDDDFDDMDYLDRMPDVMDACVVRDSLRGASFTSNHVTPLHEGVWTHGINSSLVANIRSTRYPLYPSANQSLVRPNGVPFPIQLPLHGATPDFALLPFNEKAYKRKKSDVIHTHIVTPAAAAAAAAGPTPTAPEAMGSADGFSWNLLPVGASLRLSSAFAAYDAASGKGGLSKDDPLSVWCSMIDGYATWWSSNDALATLEVSDASIWSTYCRLVLRHDGYNPVLAVGENVLFSHPTNNSLTQITLMVRTIRDDHTSTRRDLPSANTLDFALRMAHSSLYMICLQFWLICNNRFMRRTRREGAAGGVFAADHPAYPFILNVERDLPTKHGAALPFNISSGESVVNMARTTHLSVFVSRMLDIPSVHSIGGQPAPQSGPIVEGFIQFHIKSNREKTLLARKFVSHAIPNLIEHIKTRYANGAPDSVPVIHMKPTQHPGGDACTPLTLSIAWGQRRNKILTPYVPVVYSHTFMVPDAPLFTTDPTLSQASFVAEQECRDIRHIMSPGVSMKIKDDDYWDCVNNMLSVRASVTRRIIYWMQYLPYLSKTDTASMDKCITRHYQGGSNVSDNMTALMWTFNTITRQQKFVDERSGLAELLTCKLPSDRSHNSLATLPRSYDPIVPNASHIYSCYQIRTAVDDASPVTRMYRYIREYEYAAGMHIESVGSHHILAMSLEAWHFVAHGARQHVASKVDVINRVTIESVSLNHYIPCVHRDAWLYFSAYAGDANIVLWSDMRTYGLYVYLSYFVTTECQLVSAFLALVNVDHISPTLLAQVFGSLQASARMLHQSTIVSMFAPTSPVHAYQVFNSMSFCTGNVAQHALPHLSCVPFVGKLTEPPSNASTIYTRLFQFDIVALPVGVPDALIRLHRFIRGVMNAIDVADIDSAWLFTVRPTSALVDKCRGSASLRAMFDSIAVNQWNEFGMTVTSRQLASMCIVSFNVLVLDVISICMDFQVPLMLAETEPGVAWFDTVHESDIFSDLDLDSYHNDINHQIDTLAPQVDRFLRSLNANNNANSVIRLQAWTNKQIAYLDVINMWIVNSQRRDANAQHVMRLHERMSLVLQRVVVVGPVAGGIAIAPIEPISSERADMSEARMMNEFVTRLIADMKRHDGSASHAPLFTSEYYHTCRNEIVRATGITNPAAITDRFRKLISELRTNDWVRAQFIKYGKTQNNAEVKALFTAAPASSAVLVAHPAFRPSSIPSSSSSLMLSSSAIVHHPAA